MTAGPQASRSAWKARRPAPVALLAFAGVAAAITAICIAWLDAPVARWIATHDVHDAAWDRAIDAVEAAFGFWLSKLTIAAIAVIGMMATVVVPRWRSRAPAWMFVAATHLISLVAMATLKDATSRLRPNEWGPLHATRTFWMPEGASFVSGHVTYVASVLLPIAIVVPRWRVPLYAVIAVVAAARIARLAHFVSDTTGALALVALIAWLCGAAIRPRSV